MPTLICKICGKEFSILSSQVRKGRGRYCSRECVLAEPVRNYPRLDPKTFVETHSQQITETGCWICNGQTQTSGYGRFKYEGKNIPAHRFSWCAFNEKEIPDGMVVMHKCDTPMCVNPGHLTIGTQKENMADRDRKGRGRPGSGRILADPRVVSLVRRDSGTLREIAARHGLSVGCVYNIRANKIKAYEGF